MKLDSLDTLVKVQSIVQNFVCVIESVFKILLLSKKSNLSYSSREKENVIILGNGPSLGRTIKDNGSLFINYDLLAVNYFANTDYFEEFKPLHYVFLAPEYWRNDVNDRILGNRTKLFTNIARKVTWKMNLYVPSFAKSESFWHPFFLNNNNINIIFVNTTAVEGFKKFKHFAFSQNLGMPRPHNVLIPSLLIGINLGYKSIYLVGADHSWLNNIVVTDDNEVLVTQKHFYDHRQAKPNPMYTLNQEHRKLHEVLHKFTMSFRSYFEILDYSKYRRVKIFNSTPYSYIDAFERRSIK